MKSKLDQTDCTLAFRLVLEKLEEGYLYSEYIVHASNRSEARSKLLLEIRHDGMQLRGTDTEVTFLNIPVQRDRNHDKVLFEGSYLSRSKIRKIEEERARTELLDKILSDESISHCYIQKGSYYRPNWCGYTDQLSQAGVYTKSEAVSHVKGVHNAFAIPIDIEIHNRNINNDIADLHSRLINEMVEV